MANWSKRNTQTFKGSKNRITRTNSSKGTSTYSSSKKVGNTRTTQSTKSNSGKIKIYTTETHPTLGTRRTVKTLNPTVKYKKPKRAKSRSRPKKYLSNYSGGSGVAVSWPSIPYIGWIAAAALLLILGAAWYIWLILISAFLKFEVDIFK